MIEEFKELPFSKDANGNSKYASFTGNVECMLSKLIESNMKFGNYKDLVEGRFKDKNRNDRSLFIQYAFTCMGNPVFNRDDGEQVIIHDLEHPDLVFVKKLILQQYFYVPLSINKDIYQRIKESEGTFTLDKNLVMDLRNNPYSHPIQREEIAENFCQRDVKLAKLNINLIKKYFNVKTTNRILGYYPGNFTGLGFVSVGFVGKSPTTGVIGGSQSFVEAYDDIRYDDDRLFGVNIEDISKTSRK